MSDCTSNNSSDKNDNVIPFSRRDLKQGVDNAFVIWAKTFSVNTEKIFFFSAVYLDQNQQYQSDGYLSFKGGHTLYFKMSAYSDSEVENRCLAVAQRIARIYDGALQVKTFHYDQYTEKK